MSTLADETVFASWYQPIPYTRYDYFARRAAAIQGRFSNPSTRILVAGCGFGYMIEALRGVGYTSVWGCDASAWAINQGKTLIPSVASFLTTGDALSGSSMDGVRSFAGLHGQQRFDACITEDLLSCAANDGEAQTMLTNLRAVATQLGHILTVFDPGDDPSRYAGDCLWHTVTEWKALINVASEWIFDPLTAEQL